MPGSRARIKALDYVIITFTLVVIGLISAQIYIGGRGTPEIAITGADGQWIYPLDSEVTVPVPGPLGDTVVVIREGTVEVLSSPCPEQICVKTGKVSKPGQWIACLPNKVFVAVRGRRNEQPDAISQ